MGKFSEKLFGKYGLLKNIAVLVAGTGLAQIINLLTAPILTRIYSPEEFALFSLFFSIASIISVFATMRYELAVVLPEKEEDAKKILGLSGLIVLFISMLTLIGVICWDMYERFFTVDRMNPCFYLLPFYVWFAGIFQAYNYWSTRRGTFGLNFGSRVVSVGANAGTAIGLGLAAVGPVGLIIGAVVGQMGGMLVVSWETLRGIKRFFAGVDRKGMRDVAVTNRKFPLYNAPHALIDTLQDQGVVFFLKYYFAPSIISFYSQAFRILKAPLGFIGSAIYQVIYPRFAERYAKGDDIRGTLRWMYVRLALGAFPFFLVLYIYTVPLFSWFFGAKWAGAGEIAHVLVPWLYLNFIVSPISCVALVTGKQGQAALFTVLEITVRFSALIYGGMRHDYMLSFKIISVFGSALMIFALFWYHWIAKPKTIRV